MHNINLKFSSSSSKAASNCSEILSYTVRWFFSKKCLFSLIILFTLITIFYALSFVLGYQDLFITGLEKVGFSLGGRALSWALRGLGCSAGLALTLGFALRFLLFVTGQEFHMLPSGEGTSGPSGSGGSGQPPAPAPEGQGPRQPLDPAIPEEVLWDELEQPLIPRGERVDALLLRRLYGENGHPLLITDSRYIPVDLVRLGYEVEAQVDVEIELEKFLRHHGYNPGSINANRDKIRGFVFYPHAGKPIPEETLLLDLEQMEENFALSRPFREIEGAINRRDLFLRRPGDPL